IHYAWIVVAASFLVTFTLAEAFYAFGVFIGPLEADFGWNRATTSSAMTAFLISYSLSAFTMGHLGDRYGPRMVVSIGGVLAAAGFILASFIGSIWELRMALFLAGMGAGSCWVVPSATVQRWFVKRRGLATGLMGTGVGLGALIMVPTANYLMESYGWRATYLIFGIGFLVLIVSGAQFLVHSPKHKGLQPYGDEGLDNGESITIAPPSGELTLGRSVRTKAFFVLAPLLMMTQIPTQIMIAHLIPFAISIGIGAVLAATAMGLLGGLSIPGRLIFGAACDRIGWQRSLALTNVGMGIATLLLFLVDNYSTLLLFVLVFSSFHGGRNAPQAGILGYYFGLRALGGMIGLMQALSLLAGATGPYIAGYIFDQTGSYSLVFLLVASLFVIGGSLIMMVKPPHKIR
ncbi:MAG: MFS transporter, partial [Dehalococcoidia bacterium]|nr:MFS transporter [Dehalococcoidia bacterium]